MAFLKSLGDFRLLRFFKIFEFFENLRLIEDFLRLSNIFTFLICFLQVPRIFQTIAYWVGLAKSGKWRLRCTPAYFYNTSNLSFLWLFQTLSTSSWFVKISARGIFRHYTPNFRIIKYGPTEIFCQNYGISATTFKVNYVKFSYNTLIVPFYNTSLQKFVS